jgi:hypothetical protein
MPMAMYIKGIGKTIRQMAMAYITTQMGQSIRDNGYRMNTMVMVFKNLQTVQFIMGIFAII